MVVRARLPRTPPKIDCTQRMSRSEMPPLARISPAKMKKGTASRLNLSIEPSIISGTAASGTLMKNPSASMVVTIRIRKIGMPANSRAKGRVPSSDPMARLPGLPRRVRVRSRGYRAAAGDIHQPDERDQGDDGETDRQRGVGNRHRQLHRDAAPVGVDHVQDDLHRNHGNRRAGARHHHRGEALQPARQPPGREVLDRVHAQVGVVPGDQRRAHEYQPDLDEDHRLLCPENGRRESIATDDVTAIDGDGRQHEAAQQYADQGNEAAHRQFSRGGVARRQSAARRHYTIVGTALRYRRVARDGRVL